MHQSGGRTFCSTILQLLVINVALNDAARILGISPFASSSHIILMSSIFRELATRGHEVTVITAMPLKNVPSNVTQIKLELKKEDFLGEDNNMFDLGDMSPFVLIPFMWMMGNAVSEATLKSPDVQKLIQSSENKFDLIVVEKFFDEAILGFAQKFNAPFVSVVTFAGTEFITDAVGDPYPYAYVPSPFLKYGDHMTFFQRLHNTIISFFSKIAHYYYFIPAQDKIMRKYFTGLPNLPPLADIIRNCSLLLLNTHFSHGFPRPKGPNSLEVGGLHIKPAKKLPEDIQKFLDHATNGAIYFSMGSNLKSSEMSVGKKEAFLKAFSKLKQKVLWKYEENLQDVPENVKVSKWFPQSDILGHPNIRVFMTHGGLLSSQEAMYNGVPLVGIPIFADQELNVLRAVGAGYCLHLDFANVTEASVFWTLNEVISNPKYKVAAESASKLFHDQPQTPMEQAMYWIEYVIRHKGARHLRSASLDLTWYQLYLLDVIVVILAAAVSSSLLLVWVLKRLFKLIVRKSQKTQIPHSKKRN